MAPLPRDYPICGTRELGQIVYRDLDHGVRLIEYLRLALSAKMLLEVSSDLRRVDNGKYVRRAGRDGGYQPSAIPLNLVPGRRHDVFRREPKLLLKHLERR